MPYHFRSLIYYFFIHISDNGRLCIRFGMVSMETDVEELLALVINTGKQLDEQVLYQFVLEYTGLK